MRHFSATARWRLVNERVGPPPVDLHSRTGQQALNAVLNKSVARESKSPAAGGASTASEDGDGSDSDLN